MGSTHKQNMWEFTVEGKGLFPLDMLRYDRCWPKVESETGVMLAAALPRSSRNNEPYQIHLMGLSEPTDRRWESFGFRVVETTRSRWSYLVPLT